MRSSIFKKSIIISTLWHLTVFSLFSFSSGDRLPKINYSGVYFFGGILSNYGLVNTQNLTVPDIKKLFFNKTNTVFLDKNRQHLTVSSYYQKPQVNLAFNEYKNTVLSNTSLSFIKLPKKESVVIFYPQLPYHFLLYFKDRQAVHIELVFDIISNTKTNSIIVKRKISSGNLEADLLTMRYLSHYLFIQQMGLPTNNWQSVKIELSPKND